MLLYGVAVGEVGHSLSGATGFREFLQLSDLLPGPNEVGPVV